MHAGDRSGLMLRLIRTPSVQFTSRSGWLVVLQVAKKMTVGLATCIREHQVIGAVFSAVS
jgi:hypothetical protein